jgi:hypothetical protein
MILNLFCFFAAAFWLLLHVAVAVTVVVAVIAVIVVIVGLFYLLLFTVHVGLVLTTSWVYVYVCFSLLHSFFSFLVFVSSSSCNVGVVGIVYCCYGYGVVAGSSHCIMLCDTPWMVIVVGWW